MNRTAGSIGVIICYFGEFPWYFQLFLHSCRYNPTIDFLIFSDQPPVSNRPSNVYFTKLSFDALKQIIESKMGFSVALDDPYKLTDFKPAYGLIFEDIITKYDFWGHGDLDVVYGNIRAFMTKEVLLNDVITVRYDHIAGVFTLFKNTFQNNRLFTRSRDFKRVMQVRDHCCFDETNFAYEAFRNRSTIPPPIADIESMSHLLLRLSCEENLRVYFDMHILEGMYEDVLWLNGKVFYQSRLEVMLYHLLILKQNLKNYELPDELPDRIQFGINKIVI